MSLWDKLFWVWFVLSGISVAFALFINPSFSSTVGLLIGVVIIATGIVKLSDEITSKELKDVNAKILDTLHWIKEGINKLGTNTGIPMEEDEQHKMLAKKIIELENRMNKVSKALTAEIVDIKTKQGGGEFVEIKDTEQEKQEQPAE